MEKKPIANLLLNNKKTIAGSIKKLNKREGMIFFYVNIQIILNLIQKN